VGLDNAFDHLEWEQFSKHCAIEWIEWRFNPPAAAWWGGWWERLIRLLKQLLCKTLRKALLTYEELEMVVCDCESVINSRPLTYVSEDVTDLVLITPSMFLLDLKGVGLADCDAVN
jgi:membrane-bound acyltransferase YfiQ involved in biofilm formation